MSDSDEPSGVIGTLLKKHFSWENLVVLLVGDGIGLSLCIAAGDAALKKECADSDLFRPGIPRRSRPGFRFEAGQHSEMNPATVPI